MPMTDRRLSPQQLVLLRNAARFRRRFAPGTQIDWFDWFAKLPEATILEIIRTVRDPYSNYAELYALPDEIYCVVDWRKGNAALAVSPALGDVTENQPFRLSASIVDMAKANTDPQAQWNAGRSDRKRFGVVGGVFALLAALAYLAGANPQAGGAAVAFSLLAVLMFAFPLVLAPLSDNRARTKVKRALAELSSA